MFTARKGIKIDFSQLSGWGYSAGAYLILMAGLNPNIGLSKIVAGGTPADLTAWPESPLVIGLLGMPLKENPDLWKQASSVN